MPHSHKHVKTMANVRNYKNGLSNQRVWMMDSGKEAQRGFWGGAALLLPTLPLHPQCSFQVWCVLGMHAALGSLGAEEFVNSYCPKYVKVWKVWLDIV